MKQLLIIAVALMVAATAGADVLTLKDGTTLAGDVKRTDTGYEVHTPDGSVRTVPADRVASIAAGKAGIAAGATAAGAPPAESVAADRLASLRRSVEPLR